jgi:Cupin domain
MASIESKSMDSPDERHTPTKVKASVVHLRTATVKRLQAEPGFRWSECIKPVVGGESCESAHLGYVVSGTLHIAADDGAEADLGPGDAYRIDPGHDAWVLGDEPLVALEFESKTAETDTKG